jgi:hypothetical protein
MAELTIPTMSAPKSVKDLEDILAFETKVKVAGQSQPLR